jgi:hypothetical protein
MRNKSVVNSKIIWALPILLVLIGVALLLPPVRDRLTPRLEELRTRLFYTFKPPEESVFIPKEQLAAMVEATLSALTPTPTPTSAPQITPTSTPEPQFTAAPTLVPTQLPPKVALKGVKYITQHGHWNYCAPANLGMALSFWGWQGNQDEIGPYLKPYEKDKNVMPYEMIDFVANKTTLNIVVRQGGTVELLKALVAGGFPVIIEKGTFIHETTTGRLSWMGHYEVVTGYDDARQVWITQDSYFTPDYLVPYNTFINEWRGFNYIYAVVYPPNQQTDLFAILGESVDPAAADRKAAEYALGETANLKDLDLYLAWFNRGTSLTRLKDYKAAAQAYDEAFKLYPNLPKDKRPWRMMWYQTGPYFAYFYTGRYQDVLDLANNTISTASEPFIEETYYWRGLAKGALGDVNGEIEDLNTALKYHAGFDPALAEMQRLGVTPSSAP